MKLQQLFAALALTLVASIAGAQAQHAHVHGLVKLDVAVDGPTLTIAIDSPLDNIVGFERAPRNDAEKKIVAQVVTQLRTPDALFGIDPAAGCKAAQIDLDAPVIGLGESGASRDTGHADLDAVYTFACADAAKARGITLKLFDAFRTVRRVDAQIASPQGQFRRTVIRPSDRLRWGR